VLAAVAAVALAAALDALRPRSSEPGPSAGLPPAAAPKRVALRGSPETAFLPSCDPARLALAIEAGPTLALRYAGGRCQLAGLDLVAVVRDAAGAVVYRGPATERHAFARNLAGRQKVEAPLLQRALRCGPPALFAVVVRGGGLAARGTIRCREGS